MVIISTNLILYLNNVIEPFLRKDKKRDSVSHFKDIIASSEISLEKKSTGFYSFYDDFFFFPVEGLKTLISD